MSNDFLKDLAGKADKELGDEQSPYKAKKESSRPVQIRESVYKRIKFMSFKKDVKMIDLVDSMLKYALDSDKFNNK